MLNVYYLSFKIVQTFFNLLIVVILNFRYLLVHTRLPKKSSKSISILGNGPSLNIEVPKIMTDFYDNDLMVVNSFCLSDYFSILKPNYYVIFDPAFFRETKYSRISSLQYNVLESLVDKVNWKMVLFIPIKYKKSRFHLSIRERNSLIEVCFVKNIPLIGGFDFFSILSFKLGFANPIFQNVLIVCIFLSIKMNYNNINLWGSNHSWLENLQVLEDNSISLDDKHLSISDSNIIKLTDEHGNLKKLHEFLFQLYNAFSTYHLLNYYAKTMCIDIVNYTKNSFIDAFNKK